MSSVSGIQDQTLEVTVVSCNELKDTEWISRHYPYVCLEYGSFMFRTRTCTDGNKNPTFQEKFTFNLIEGLGEIIVNVWNSNTTSLDDFIGTGKIQLYKVLSQGYDDNTWTLHSQTGRYAGEVRLIMHYANANKHGSSHAPSAPPYGAAAASQYAPPPSAAAAASQYAPPPSAAAAASQYAPPPSAAAAAASQYAPPQYGAAAVASQYAPPPSAVAAASKYAPPPYGAAAVASQYAPPPYGAAAASQYAPPPSAARYSYTPAAAYLPNPAAAYLPNPAAYPPLPAAYTPSPYNAPPQPAAFPPRPYPPATYPPQPHPLPPQGSSYSYLASTLGVLKVIDLVVNMSDSLL